MPQSPHISASLTPASNDGLPGWEDLSHSGLLLDAARLAELAGHAPAPLGNYAEDKLRRRAIALLDGAQTDSADASRFVAFVLEEMCGFDAATGVWQRGSHVPPAEGRRIVTGETVKPRHLWKGREALACRCSWTMPCGSAEAAAQQRPVRRELRH